MKRALFVISAVLWAGPASAQEAPKPPPAAKEASTKLDAFLGSKGSLIIRDIQVSGVVKGPEGDFSFLAVSAVAAYLPGKETQKVKGFQCSMYRARGRGLSDSGSCTLDVEEAESLSKALQYLTELAPKLTSQPLDKDEERQAFFITKDDFRVGYTLNEGKLKPSVRIGSISPITIELGSVENFASIKTAVDRGLAWLKSR